jgi:hypothetical protein
MAPATDWNRSEVFLLLLPHSRFIVERILDQILVRFQENRRIKMSSLTGLPSCFAMLAARRLLNAPAANIPRDFIEGISEPQRHAECGADDESTRNAKVREHKRIAMFTETVQPQYLEHGLCLGLFIHIFNLHTQPERSDKKYLHILNEVALEMVRSYTSYSPCNRNGNTRCGQSRQQVQRLPSLRGDVNYPSWVI